MSSSGLETTLLDLVLLTGAFRPRVLESGGETSQLLLDVDLKADEAIKQRLRRMKLSKKMKMLVVV